MTAIIRSVNASAKHINMRLTDANLSHVIYYMTTELESRLTISETPKKVLLTEDTGKMFEMAICLAYDIPYSGKYKYNMETPMRLKERLKILPTLFPQCTHTAKRGSQYDYTAISDTTLHLSAKTTKKGVGKVAPQVIGQSQPKKFCDIIGIEYTTDLNLKQYIQANITDILPILIKYTFDCPNLYYNQELDTIRFITMTHPIDFNRYTYTWTCDCNKWNNSSTLKLISDSKKEIPLVEFQFHTLKRTNMAIRWCYENFLNSFKENLSIVTI